MTEFHNTGACSRNISRITVLPGPEHIHNVAESKCKTQPTFGRKQPRSGRVNRLLENRGAAIWLWHNLVAEKQNKHM